MVAKITVPNSIKRALNYNEQKLKEGKAQCIHGHNFLKEAEQLNFFEKLHRFEQLIALNKRATTNAVHISLNFGLNEKLEKEKLAEIAMVYMQKIGFGEQPYLVYQHLDAGHPHIHIVTTSIKQDGKRISLHNLGRNESSKAREEIERAYKLVRAKDQQKHANEVKPINALRVNYGKSPTKRGITNVLDAVLPHYKYVSLAELNAVLRLYNLVADRGKENGIIFRKNGLVYRVLDEKGNKIGVPIKASSIYSKPTLSFLEKRFKENESQKHEHKKHLQTTIDWILVKPPKNLPAFKQALEKEKISLVIRQNDQGLVYGLTYIDHHTKSVFNGSDIGKQYSAKGILEKCGIVQYVPEQAKAIEHTPVSQTKKQEQHHEITPSKQLDIGKIIEDVIKPTEEIHYLPYELKKRRKRKKRNQ
ncbi:MAG TPA: relaxase/mobilization nuclease domain-containing protein [Chitinophagaceae bacterium]|nr:relaxase/mobilization nuclease domain-containing protein [Chitinophagaceae bacterium]